MSADPFWIRDLPSVFNDFSQAATYTDSTGSYSVRVIFDNEYLSLDFLDASAATRDPQVWIRTDDLTSPAPRDSIKIDDVTYYVTSVEPDGTGLTKLMLSKDQT